MGRKKKPETLAKEREKLEKEIAVLEQDLKEKNHKIDLSNRISKTQETIREDLINQLQEQEKFGKHFDDMVEDYVYFVGLKLMLQDDINSNGIRYKAQTGNGYTTFKPNESVQNLVKVNAQMLKILSELNLKEPVLLTTKEAGGDAEDDLLQRN